MYGTMENSDATFFFHNNLVHLSWLECVRSIIFEFRVRFSPVVDSKLKGRSCCSISPSIASWTDLDWLKFVQPDGTDVQPPGTVIRANELPQFIDPRLQVCNPVAGCGQHWPKKSGQWPFRDRKRVHDFHGRSWMEFVVVTGQTLQQITSVW